VKGSPESFLLKILPLATVGPPSWISQLFFMLSHGPHFFYSLAVLHIYIVLLYYTYDNKKLVILQSVGTVDIKSKETREQLPTPVDILVVN